MPERERRCMRERGREREVTCKTFFRIWVSEREGEITCIDVTFLRKRWCWVRSPDRLTQAVSKIRYFTVEPTMR